MIVLVFWEANEIWTSSNLKLSQYVTFSVNSGFKPFYFELEKINISHVYIENITDLMGTAN